MLYLYTGTDRDKARSAMMEEAEGRAEKENAEILRITDAHSPEDLRLGFAGPGLFGRARVLVLDSIVANEKMFEFFMRELPALSKSKDPFFVFEEKLLADIRRKIEKYAEKTVKHDAPRKERDNSIFALANALSRRDKKTLWVQDQRALSRGESAEAIHGILFWGAKKMLLSARKGSAEYGRGSALIASLAELPHEARRKGFEFEYALEHHLLSI